VSLLLQIEIELPSSSDFNLAFHQCLQPRWIIRGTAILSFTATILDHFFLQQRQTPRLGTRVAAYAFCNRLFVSSCYCNNIVKCDYAFEFINTYRECL
jgi:hypothetical protein